ncbi:hypothetical protein HCU01_00160 [Halomonas cupida]|uniref:Uncharacterized protein n=1 Tax=Halomonas cupida TaxID=44933 RepID=A0ABQ0W8N0_9GAMM|nr:hypothetical protein HCU01_00160 [Halomonas cupida]
MGKAIQHSIDAPDLAMGRAEGVGKFTRMRHRIQPHEMPPATNRRLVGTLFDQLACAA